MVITNKSLTKPLFRSKKAREKEWERIKNERFNLDAELELN